MRVLVTGDAGKIGAVVAARLRRAGAEVVGFDLVRGEDVRDAAAVARAARGCAAAVHLAAVRTDRGVDPSTLMAVNVLGTWHVLLAAREHGLARVVVFSSANALGVFRGQRRPDYLPIDDEHPARPLGPYGVSKRLAEELCRAWTDETGVPTVCLRPPGVFDAADYAHVLAQRATDPASEWEPVWEYGAFLDVSDAAEAALCSLLCPDPGHVTLLLCADDIASDTPSRELAERLLPGVEWRGGPEYEREPRRALLDTARARTILGWQPAVRWRARAAGTTVPAA